MKKKIILKMVGLTAVTAVLVRFGVLATAAVVSITDFFVGALYTMICLIILFLVSNIEW